MPWTILSCEARVETQFVITFTRKAYISHLSALVEDYIVDYVYLIVTSYLFPMEMVLFGLCISESAAKLQEY